MRFIIYNSHYKDSIHRINSTDWKLYSGISQLVVNSSRRSITVQTFARDYLRAIKRNAFHYILIQIQNSFSTTIDITISIFYDIFEIERFGFQF